MARLAKSLVWLGLVLFSLFPCLKKWWGNTSGDETVWEKTGREKTGGGNT